MKPITIILILTMCCPVWTADSSPIQLTANSLARLTDVQRDVVQKINEDCLNIIKGEAPKHSNAKMAALDGGTIIYENEFYTLTACKSMSRIFGISGMKYGFEITLSKQVAQGGNADKYSFTYFKDFPKDGSKE